MSQTASRYAVFARDVAEHGRVWTVRDDGGFPAPKTPDGNRAMPFWSSLSRVERIILCFLVIPPLHFLCREFLRLQECVRELEKMLEQR